MQSNYTNKKSFTAAVCQLPAFCIAGHHGSSRVTTGDAEVFNGYNGTIFAYGQVGVTAQAMWTDRMIARNVRRDGRALADAAVSPSAVVENALPVVVCSARGLLRRFLHRL